MSYTREPELTLEDHLMIRKRFRGPRPPEQGESMRKTRKVQVTLNAEIDDSDGRTPQRRIAAGAKAQLERVPHPSAAIFLKVTGVQVTELDERRR